MLVNTTLYLIMSNIFTYMAMRADSVSPWKPDTLTVYFIMKCVCVCKSHGEEQLHVMISTSHAEHFMGLEMSTHTCTPAPSNRTQPVQLSTNFMFMMSSSQVRRGFTHLSTLPLCGAPQLLWCIHAHHV